MGLRVHQTQGKVSGGWGLGSSTFKSSQVIVMSRPDWEHYTSSSAVGIDKGWGPLLQVAACEILCWLSPLFWLNLPQNPLTPSEGNLVSPSKDCKCFPLALLWGPTPADPPFPSSALTTISPPFLLGIPQPAIAQRLQPNSSFFNSSGRNLTSVGFSFFFLKSFCFFNEKFWDHFRFTCNCKN